MPRAAFPYCAGAEGAGGGSDGVGSNVGSGAEVGEGEGGLPRSQGSAKGSSGTV